MCFLPGEHTCKVDPTFRLSAYGTETLTEVSLHAPLDFEFSC